MKQCPDPFSKEISKIRYEFYKIMSNLQALLGSSSLSLSLYNSKDKLGMGALQWRVREMRPLVARTRIVSVFFFAGGFLISPFPLPFKTENFKSEFLSVTFIKRLGSGSFCHYLGNWISASQLDHTRGFVLQ